MKRFVAVTPVVLCFLAFAPGAFAQASKATPATPTATAPPPVNRARMATPVQGPAFEEVIQGQGKQIGGDMVTVSKVKNVSNAPIAGLRIDEFWYNQKLEQVTGDTQRVRTPIAAGEVVEVTTRSPMRPGLYRSTLILTHANGKVTAKGVKKFTEEKK